MAPAKSKNLTFWLIIGLLVVLLAAAGYATRGYWKPRRLLGMAKAVVYGTPTPLPTPTPRPTFTVFPTWTPAPLQPETQAILIGAGDIEKCGGDGAKQTAGEIEEIIDHLTGTPDTLGAPDTQGTSEGVGVVEIFTAGDNSNDSGTLDEYECFKPNWGRFKDRIHPAVGNHDYFTPLAEGYYNYFGAAAGDPTKGYYSFNLGAWHIVMLNSNCAQVGGCNAGSPQESWLKADLVAYPARCTLAVWHEPLFISGDNNATNLRPFWQDLYNAGAEIVVSGHQHQYERFAPQDTDGRLDLSRGIREFVVGTGGGILELPITDGIRHNSETIISQEHGVIEFTLYPTSYQWQFLPVDRQARADAGQGECH